MAIQKYEFIPSHLRSEDKMSSRLTPTLPQLGGDSHQHKYKWKSRFGRGKGVGAILHVFGEIATWKCQVGSRICGSEDKKKENCTRYIIGLGVDSIS